MELRDFQENESSLGNCGRFHLLEDIYVENAEDSIYWMWQIYMWSSWDDYQDKKVMPNKIEVFCQTHVRPKKGLTCTFWSFLERKFPLDWIALCWFLGHPVFLIPGLSMATCGRNSAGFPNRICSFLFRPCLYLHVVCDVPFKFKKMLLVSGEENCHDKITSFCVNLLHFMQAQGSSLTCLPTNLMPPACCVTYTFGGGWTS